MFDKNIYTLNQMVDVFRDIANRHQQLKGFGFGDFADVGKSKNLVYPFLWVNVIPSQNISLKTVDYNFRLIVFDKVSQPKDNDRGDESTNGLEVLSDTMSIIRDIILLLRYDKYYRNANINLTNNPGLSPAKDAFDSRVNGWFTDINLQVPSNYNTCDIPITPRQ